MCKKCNCQCQHEESEHTSDIRELISAVQSLEAQVSQLTDAIEHLETLFPNAQHAEHKYQEDKFNIRKDKDEVVTNPVTTTEATRERQSLGANGEVSQMLFNQLKADCPSDWVQVAKCPMAKTEHLLQAAKLCSGMKYCKSPYAYCTPPHYCLELAEAISNHPQTDDSVIQELMKSLYYDVWLLAVGCQNIHEPTLQYIAKRCVDAEWTNDTTVIATVRKIAYHSNRTAMVLENLSHSGSAIVREIVHTAMHDLTGIEEIPE